jgi:type VI secretion system secreted protein VgrG
MAWSARTDGRQLRLRPAEGRAGEMLALLLPQRIAGSESVCGGIEYRIACLAAMPTLPLKNLIALPVEIEILTDRGRLRSVCGFVTKARGGDFDGGLAAYHLVVRDALAITEKRTNSRAFRYRSEVEIVQTLCDEWRHSNHVLASAVELELDVLLDATQFLAREQTMQYKENDAAFVLRLLKRRGIAWYIRLGRCHTSPLDRTPDAVPEHTLVLLDSAANSL